MKLSSILTDVILSTDEQQVRQLLQQGKAALVLEDIDLDKNIPHIVFDWDSTIIDTSGDVMVNKYGRQYFASFEWHHRLIPHAPGIMYPLFKELSLRKDMVISILTARTVQETARLMTTLDYWNIHVNGLYSCANLPKGPIAKAINADLHIDDINRHIIDVRAHGICAAWLPVGDAVE